MGTLSCQATTTISTRRQSHVHSYKIVCTKYSNVSDTPSIRDLQYHRMLCTCESEPCRNSMNTSLVLNVQTVMLLGSLKGDLWATGSALLPNLHLLHRMHSTSGRIRISLSCTCLIEDNCQAQALSMKYRFGGVAKSTVSVFKGLEF